VKQREKHFLQVARHLKLCMHLQIDSSPLIPHILM